MGYPWEDLDDAQFERVVVEIARELFGIGVQSFAAGRDGGATLVSKAKPRLSLVKKSLGLVSPLFRQSTPMGSMLTFLTLALAGRKMVPS